MGRNPREYSIMRKSIQKQNMAELDLKRPINKYKITMFSGNT